MSPPLTDRALAARHDFARDLAETIGAYARELQLDGESLAVASKGLQDFVTSADKACEALIRAAINDAFPDDGFMGEESGGAIGHGPTWVIDPIDGTNNYMRGLPNWGVSIALVAAGEIVLGAVFDGTNGQVYHACKGCGAFAGDTPLRVSRNADPQTALAITGHSRRTPIGPYLKLLETLHDLGFDHRRPGAAALGLLRVAEGKAELFHEAHLNSWDVLAGLLIAREAGAHIDHPPLPELLRQGGSIWATAPALRPRLDALVGKEHDVNFRV